MEEREFFAVDSGEYVAGTNYRIVRPASLNRPKNHAVRPCADPHLEYCRFFRTHHITGLCPPDETEAVNGSYVAKGAKIGRNTVIFPGCYIGGDTVIGEDCYIGSGVKIIGRVQIGNRVRIRENTVIGTDGLSTDRDEEGHPADMPQFGGVVIEDDVKIGANAVVHRGAIDDTVLEKGCKIDGQVLGNYVHVGDRAFVGMGSVVTKDIPDGWVAYGSPAKPVRKRFEE